MSRFTKTLALGAVTAGLLAASAGPALAGHRHSSTPPRSAAVSAAPAAQGLASPSASRHSS